MLHAKPAGVESPPVSIDTPFSTKINVMGFAMGYITAYLLILLSISSCVNDKTQEFTRKRNEDKSYIANENIVDSTTATGLRNAFRFSSSVRYLFLTGATDSSIDSIVQLKNLIQIKFFGAEFADIDTVIRKLSTLEKLTTLEFEESKINKMRIESTQLLSLRELYILDDTINGSDMYIHPGHCVKKLCVNTLGWPNNLMALSCLEDVSINDVTSDTLNKQLFYLPNLKNIDVPANTRYIPAISTYNSISLNVTGSVFLKTELDYYRRFGAFNQIESIRKRSPNIRFITNQGTIAP